MTTIVATITPQQLAEALVRGLNGPYVFVDRDGDVLSTEYPLTVDRHEYALIAEDGLYSWDSVSSGEEFAAKTVSEWARELEDWWSDYDGELRLYVNEYGELTVF